jgi:hypothetical protein
MLQTDYNDFLEESLDSALSAVDHHEKMMILQMNRLNTGNIGTGTKRWKECLLVLRWLEKRQGTGKNGRDGKIL